MLDDRYDVDAQEERDSVGMNQPSQPAGGQPPAAPPPVAPPPSGSGMPSWTNNLTGRGTQPGPGGVALADFTDRAIAAFVDFLIIGIIGVIVSSIMTGILGDQLLGGIFGNYKVPSLVSSLATVVIMLIVSAAYFVGMWTRMNGATVGMRVMKLSVRDAASGAMVTQPQAINRWLVLGAPFALSSIYGWGIGLILSIVLLVYFLYLVYTTASSPTRQGFHDTFAKTVVAKG
ncbi:MAG: RDD family protein [Chloroflexota bacterium]